ncbi:hypothetical protein MLD38_019795 [Melastoma candidum]|uniref:Uncharacterized protein n=1 Tax=Melastoma candidum TaxID=119954 RepID=A0ACB9QIW0_9MYRT|nr:hypothetical protein MLD38_019795 [Melastoma candidum]
MFPLCSFLVWLIAKRRLRTAHFWHHKGLWASSACAFCLGAEETTDHLFFQCNFTKQLWAQLGQLLRFKFLCTMWEDMEQLYSLCAGAKGATRITNAAIIMLYYIWLERGKRRTGSAVSSVGSIVVRVFGLLKAVGSKWTNGFYLGQASKL